MGGFIGDGANIFTLKNSTNNGAVSSNGTVGLAAIQYRVGGFVGSITKGTSAKHIFQNLTNTGDVSAATSSTPDLVEVGGILGFVGIASTSLDGCKSGGNVSFTGSAKKTLVRGIVGNTTKVITIKNCAVAGNVDGTTLDADNFSGYIWGTSAATAPAVKTENNTFWAE